MTAYGTMFIIMFPRPMADNLAESIESLMKMKIICSWNEIIKNDRIRGADSLEYRKNRSKIVF